MAAQVGSLYTSLTLESSSFVVGLKKATEQTARSSAAIEGHLNTIVNAGKALVGGAIAQQILAVGQRALEYASSLGEVSQQLGVTTRDLQVYRYAASQVGIEQEEMDKGLSKLTLSIGQAADGAKKQATTFRDLGISVTQANGQVRTAGEVLPDLAEALSKIKDPATRARIEVELFGKTGQKLDTLLAGGREQVDQLSAAADRLGVVLSPDLIQRADDAADKLSAVQQVLEANIAKVVAENAGSILQLADAFGELVSKLPAAISWLQKAQLRVSIFQDTIAQYTVGLGGVGSARQRQQVRARLVSERDQLGMIESKEVTDDLARRFPLRLSGSTRLAKPGGITIAGDGGGTRRTAGKSGGGGKSSEPTGTLADHLKEALDNAEKIGPAVLEDQHAFTDLGQAGENAMRDVLWFTGTAVDEIGRVREQTEDLARSLNQDLTEGLVGVARGFNSLGDVALRVIEDVGNAVIAKLMPGGTGGIGGAIANLIFGGGSSGGLGVSSTIANAAPISVPTFSIPGFASGGSMQIGGLHGVDRNLLSLNGQPVARVSRGEMLSISNDNGSGRGEVFNITLAPNFAGSAVDRRELIAWSGALKQDFMRAVDERNRRRG